MPSTYQAPPSGDTETDRTYSQTPASNLPAGQATVAQLLAGKRGAVHTITPDDTLATAVTRLRDHRIGALVVTAAGEAGAPALRGILSERDIVRKLAETPGRTLPQRVSEVMTAEVQTCTPDDTLVSVLHRMTEGRFRHMPVLRDGALIGMVSIGDVVNYRLIQLEHEALQLKQLIVG